MLNIGISWDRWTPGIESHVVLDALNVQGLDKVTWFVDIKKQDSTEIIKCKRILEIAGATLANELLPADSVYDAWKVYYEEERPQVELNAKKFFYKCIKQGEKKLVMRPNVENYPVFPVVERVAPMSTLPQYKPPPPRGPALNALPYWAWSN